jgi:hypothetical protein
MRRLDQGRALRAAMDGRGFTIKALAARTAELDQESRGVNWRTVGFLVSQWASGRETCTYRTAVLIAEALDLPLSQLFDTQVTRSFAQAPTSTQRRGRNDAA